MSQSPSPQAVGGLMSQSPSLHLSVGRGVYKEGEGKRTKRSREGIEKFSKCRLAQSILIRQVMVKRLAILSLLPPGFTVESQQIWNWDA